MRVTRLKEEEHGRAGILFLLDILLYFFCFRHVMQGGWSVREWTG